VMTTREPAITNWLVSLSTSGFIQIRIIAPHSVRCDLTLAFGSKSDISFSQRELFRNFSVSGCTIHPQPTPRESRRVPA
jgi:hypothetical protein